MRSPAKGRGVRETAGRLKAIHIHYPRLSPTITSSARHFQVDLSPLRVYSSCRAQLPYSHPGLQLSHPFQEYF